ncbi:hypothetical protein B0T14DRAFT_340960 [Immersiella caudata]|uniref:Uncharacterized protein n=1 Tax=Immersiella caudata TaxID=314043 RepID=A0AA39U6M7_9PEZI|nr:hypothetical protein B0T14DRAFT_340960 [Immersiella caudata]
MCTHTLELLRCGNCNTSLGSERTNSKPCANAGKSCKSNKQTKVRKRTVPIEECTRCFMMMIIEEQEALAAVHEAERNRVEKAAKKRAFKMSFEKKKGGDGEEGENKEADKEAVEDAPAAEPTVEDEDWKSVTSADEHLSVFDRTKIPLEVYFFDSGCQTLPA